MSTSDHLSLSSCTVICLWDQYYAEFSTVESVALFLSLLIMILTILTILLQKPFAHRKESCIKISAFRCIYFSVTEKWPVCQLRVCCITNIMTVYKHYVCVQTLCLCTNIMTVYTHYICVQTL